jgi:hypothetical protein
MGPARRQIRLTTLAVLLTASLGVVGCASTSSNSSPMLAHASTRPFTPAARTGMATAEYGWPAGASSDEIGSWLSSRNDGVLGQPSRPSPWVEYVEVTQYERLRVINGRPREHTHSHTRIRRYRTR